MPNYKYKALKKNGDIFEGTYTAKTRDEILSMIRGNGYQPVNVELSKGSKVIDFSFLKSIKTKDMAIFCRQFYTMLNAGVPIIKCLDILKYQTENRRFAKIISKVHDEVQKGLTFSEALKNQDEVFPLLLINMVQAGELSGNLDVIMERMAIHFEKENKLNNKVKGAMVYPIVLCVVAVTVVVFLLTAVMPTFIGMFEGSGVELPGPTKILLAISNGLRAYWYLVALVLFGIVFFIRKYKQSSSGRLAFDRWKFRLPVIKGNTQKIVTSRFTRTLATLMGSGVPLIEALEIVSKVVGNEVVARGLLDTREDLRKGIDLATPITRLGVFPPMVESMIRIGEESGSLEEILDKTANFYDEEVEASLQRMTALLEPIMILVMAVFIGFIVIAMMMPMFDMVNTVQF